MTRLSNYIVESEGAKSEILEIINTRCKPWLKEIGNNYTPMYRGTKHYIKEYMVVTPRGNRNPSDTPKDLSDKLDEVFEEKFGWRPRSQGVFAVGDQNIAGSYGSIFLFIPIGTYSYIWSPKVRDLYHEISEPGSNLVDAPVLVTEYRNATRRGIDGFVMFPSKTNIIKGSWDYNIREKRISHDELLKKYPKNKIRIVISGLHNFIWIAAVGDAEIATWIPDVTYEQFKQSQYHIVVSKFIEKHIQNYTDIDLHKAIKKGYEIMFNCNEYLMVDKFYNDAILSLFKGGSK